MQNVGCIVLDTDKKINLVVQIVFPLGHVSISTVPVENAKQFIEEDDYSVKRNISKRRSHTRLQNTIDDDQLMRADAHLNFDCARRNHSCGPHD